MRHGLLFFWLLVGVGCGSGRPPPEVPPELRSDLDAEAGAGAADGPEVAGVALPRLPVDVALDDPPLADGVAAAERVLQMRTPNPPSGDAWEVESWADQDFGDWLRRRAEAVRDAQLRLQRARNGRADHSVVASMLLGILYTRFAMDIRGISTPEAFAGDDPRTRAFREALEAASAPIWLRALDAFGSCSSVAGAQPAHSLDRWRAACDAEIRHVSAMLPADEARTADDTD